MKTFSYYIRNLNMKIDRQYVHLLAEFKSFILCQIEELDKDKLNISSTIAHLRSTTIVPRESSNRKPPPIDRLSPIFKFAKPKQKKRTLNDFLRTNVEARKKATVNKNPSISNFFNHKTVFLSGD